MELTIEVPEIVAKGISEYPDQKAILLQIQSLITAYYNALTEREGKTHVELLNALQSNAQSKGLTDEMAASLLSWEDEQIWKKG